MPVLKLRDWQVNALRIWKDHGHHGIVSVVTGGGKTILALACIKELRAMSTLIIVPTAALLEQWWEESANFFELQLDEINIIDGRLRFKVGTINIAVINTAVKLAEKIRKHRCFLIVDECHKAASEQFRLALAVDPSATLGLSATPERQYDEGLNDILIPSLGSIIYTYGYPEALKDHVIVPFVLKNIVFELEEERQRDYDKITAAIARSISKNGIDDAMTISLFIKRARVLNLSLNRIRLALRLVLANRNRRILVFHESIEACDLIYTILSQNGISSGVYHSKMHLKEKAEMLSGFRKGSIEVLVTCRSLDEGFNVPETEIGIIAASTATSRQRIQRLGRVVRPADGKSSAIIYTLVATGPEIFRLKAEEEKLEGVAEVFWTKA